MYLTLYMMTQCWTRDLCIWHYTWWRNVGLVICVSDIIHDDAMLDSWSVSDIIQNDAMLDSWSVYLTFTEWCHVGLVTYVSDIIQNDVGLVICASDIVQYDAMLDSWSVHLTLYRMTACRSRDLCIWHYTEWIHVGLVILWRHSV